MREPYEEIRDLGGGHTASIGGAIATNLDGILSENGVPLTVVKSAEFFAVSDTYCARYNISSSAAAGYSCVT